MRNVAIILAAGAGRRAGFDTPKQFLEINGRSVLEHSVDAFQANPLIDRIDIVYNSEYLSRYQQIVKDNAWSKFGLLIPGGHERYESSWKAISEYSNADDVNLIFHDAARPLVGQEIISAVVNALDTFDAVSAAVPVTDTIVTMDNDRCMATTPDRATLRRVQTPQGFRLPVIQKAYELAMADPDLKATDDCGVVRKYLPKVKVAMVEGSELNMKLTYADDAKMLEYLINNGRR